MRDPEQYAALDSEAIRRDPVLRLALRDPAVELGPGVLTSGTGMHVSMDARERTVMRETTHEGATVARIATRATMRVAADLHARHHFTAAAAVDGSLVTAALPGGGMRRQLAYGVWEGPRGSGYRSNATASGLWGASIPPDMEVADAEMAAIHAYLGAVVARAADPSRERVLILSDSLSTLDALEAAWRAGDARGLRTHDRGAMLESCCSLRARLGFVCFLFTPSHTGDAANAMADAAAKAHIGSAASDDLGSVRERVTSRACVYAIGSDFRRDGTLRPPSEREPTHRFLWDRAVFPCVRKRAARWVHTHLNEGLRGSYVDAAVIGRRWHSSDVICRGGQARAGERKARP